jgi:hypothetical protein
MASVPCHDNRKKKCNFSLTVVPNLWYALDRLGVRENNIGNGGKHTQKKELK